MITQSLQGKKTDIIARSSTVLIIYIYMNNPHIKQAYKSLKKVCTCNFLISLV